METYKSRPICPTLEVTADVQNIRFCRRVDRYTYLVTLLSTVKGIAFRLICFCQFFVFNESLQIVQLCSDRASYELSGNRLIKSYCGQRYIYVCLSNDFKTRIWAIYCFILKNEPHKTTAISCQSHLSVGSIGACTNGDNSLIHFVDENASW